jgi:hypothetical protein
MTSYTDPAYAHGALFCVHLCPQHPMCDQLPGSDGTSTLRASLPHTLFLSLPLCTQIPGAGGAGDPSSPGRPPRGGPRTRGGYKPPTELPTRRGRGASQGGCHVCDMHPALEGAFDHHLAPASYSGCMAQMEPHKWVDVADSVKPGAPEVASLCIGM